MEKWKLDHKTANIAICCNISLKLKHSHNHIMAD